MTWWAASVMTGKEYDLKRELGGLGINVDKILIPRREIVEVKNNKVNIKGEKLFPGYIIIEAESLPDLRKSGFNASILGEVSETEMDIIKEHQKSIDREGTTASIGEKIIVTSGPFIGVKGTITKVNQDKDEIDCRLTFQGQEIHITIDLQNIDRIR